METDISPAPSHFTSPTANSFLSLPLEIRHLIYHELLVQPDNLFRTFCKCGSCRECLSPSLLRTSKAIYDEALPVLYSKNVFFVLCNEQLAYPAPIDIANQRAGIDGDRAFFTANRQISSTGRAQIFDCPNDAAKLHVRRIYFKLDQTFPKVVDNYPDKWWNLVESDILRVYPALKQAQVQVKVLCGVRPTLAAQKPKSILEYNQRFTLYCDLESHPIFLETRRHAVITFQKREGLKGCKFGVESIVWIDEDGPRPTCRMETVD